MSMTSVLLTALGVDLVHRLVEEVEVGTGNGHHPSHLDFDHHVLEHRVRMMELAGGGQDQGHVQDVTV